MRVVTVNEEATEICPPGNYDFVHIYNGSTAAMFVKFDGDANQTPGFGGGNWFAESYRIPPQGIVHLNNDGKRNIFTCPLIAKHGLAGHTHDLIVHGA